MGTKLDEASKFGALVRATRKAKKLSLSEVADHVGIDAKHLGRVERGEKNASFELIVNLSRFLSVPARSFFDFEDLNPDPKALKASITQLLENQETDNLLRIVRMLREMLR